MATTDKNSWSETILRVTQLFLKLNDIIVFLETDWNDEPIIKRI